MIANVTGTLTTRDDEQIVIETEGGVGYAITVPLRVLERLPAPGSQVRLFTELVVREDGWSLYGFDQPTERAIFHRLLGASGFGPRLALALLSTLGPDRAVSSIQNRDVAALATVSGIGKKKAEKLVVELHDRFKDFTAERATGRPAAAGDAVQALVSLGYSVAAAEEAVRHTLGENGSEDAANVVRGALQWIASSRRGEGT